MSPNNLLKGKININDLLSQYDRIFQKPKVQKSVENTVNEILGDDLEDVISQDDILEEAVNNEESSKNISEMLPQKKDSNAIVAINNKDNPQISMFDAYAFNEVMRRYENSIIQLTKQSMKIQDNEQIKESYEQKINDIKTQYEHKITEIDEIKEREDSMREIIDQVNVIMDEKDEKLHEYELSVAQKTAELSLIKQELREKQESIENMERQLYTVLFKISESNTLV